MAISVLRVSALLFTLAVVPAGICNAQSLTADRQLQHLTALVPTATAC